MPRTGRGGPRAGQGTIGQQYANRSDITLPSPPGQAAPGQEYGDAGQQEMRMRQVPLSQPPPAGSREPTAPQVGAPGQGPPVAGNAPTPAQAGQPMTPANVPPGGILNQPTARPEEPVMAGVSRGEGPGPEAMVNGWGTRPPQSVPETTTADLLRALQGRPGATSTLTGMAQLAQANMRG